MEGNYAKVLSAHSSNKNVAVFVVIDKCQSRNSQFYKYRLAIGKLYEYQYDEHAKLLMRAEECITTIKVLNFQKLSLMQVGNY